MWAKWNGYRHSARIYWLLYWIELCVFGLPSEEHLTQGALAGLSTPRGWARIFFSSKILTSKNVLLNRPFPGPFTLHARATNWGGKNIQMCEKIGEGRNGLDSVLQHRLLPNLVFESSFLFLSHALQISICSWLAHHDHWHLTLTYSYVCVRHISIIQIQCSVSIFNEWANFLNWTLYTFVLWKLW